MFSGLVRTEVPKPYSQVNADIAAILHDAKKTYLLRKSDAAGSTRAHPKSAADESKRKQEHMAQKLSDIYESLRLDQSSAPSEKMPELLDKVSLSCRSLPFSGRTWPDSPRRSR